MDIIIVCHTEFGYVHKKQLIYDKKATDSVAHGVRNLRGVAGKYGAKVTFAVCPEVAGLFPKNIDHEIGLHVHPGWEEFTVDGIKFHVGDEYLQKNCKQSTTSSVLKDHSYDDQLDMIKTGKAHIADVLGVEPRSFVAGRWAINNDTVRALINTGFTHECSAVPHSRSCHYEWSELPRICMPYNPDPNNYQQKGLSPLLIVPTSQVFPIGHVSPEFVPEVGLSWLKACFREYYYQDLPLFHISLHSPCMVDDYFISVMDKFLNSISGYKNIQFKFSSEINEYDDVIAKSHIRHYLFAINRKVVWKYLGPRLRKFSHIFTWA